MATSKLSTTLDIELIEEIRRRVGPRGVSAFVNQALAEKLQKTRVLEFLDGLAAKQGPVAPKSKKEADAELARVFRAT